jgi:hypothetical protein
MLDGSAQFEDCQLLPLSGELENIDDLKDKLHWRITDALDSGRLEQAMATALAPEPKDADRGMADLRDQVHARMLTALGTGKLDEIVTDTVSGRKESKEEVPTKPSRSRGSIFMAAPEVPQVDLAAAVVAPPPVAQQHSQPPAVSALAPEQASSLESQAVLADARTDRAQLELEEDLRNRARETLVKASLDNGLERALMEVQQERQATNGEVLATPPPKEACTTPSAPVRAAPSASVKPDNQDASASDKVVFFRALEAVKQRDRRVGELLAMISETQRAVADREITCQQIEERIGATRHDISHLNLDVEWHRRALEAAKERSNELELGQRNLVGELDSQHKKLLHANIDAQESCLVGCAPSEISTATGGGTTTSSLGCYTPRNVYSRGPLDPALSASPISPPR